MAEQPPAQEITDIEALRVLAHPIRQKIEQCLRQGPGNSAGLARQLGESTGLVSYHLRQMARHGFVEEVPEPAKGRERWWRTVPGDRRYPPYSRQTPEMREALTEMHRLNLAELIEQAQQFAQARDTLGPWADAALFSRATLRLDRDQLSAFFEEYIALVHRYSPPEGEDAPDARAVLVRLLGFPEIN
ncbi:winged helix-turn-helix domain-containing protein [Streptomyces noursei]|uniref:winged helix-turn-helix domain-containing protein n=1 Tax=Streptomyces noursei TaxID=1971 RepID=UPI001675CC15|nr:helix-turn-helix domain-containing protein [Streptomyces noursei]MCZ1013482.1 helix-turn-helix domain-containing protein [Streptomyces noursei]GGX36048.1 transcriptional regulator [Streptomyces noursei]